MSGRRKNTQTATAAAAAKAKKAAAAAAAKAQKAEQDAAVRMRAAALKAHLLKALSQQQADAELDSGSPSGRNKSETPDPPSGTVAPSQQELDDDDDDGLGFELPIASSPPHFVEDEDYNGDLPPSSDVFDIGLESDDELDVADVCTPTRPRKRVASGGLSTAPMQKRQRIPPGLTAHPDDIRGKRKMSHFTPRTARVMAKVKTVARGQTVTANAFVPPESRLEYYKSLISEVAHDPKMGSEDMVKTVLRILNNCVESGSMNIFGDFIHYGDGDIKYRMMTHVRSAIHPLVTSCGTDKASIQTNVAWLKSTLAFIFGNLDMKSKTFDADKQFLAEWFVLVLRWYLFEQQGKSDLPGFHAIIGVQQIPGPTIALLSTMAFHVLTEWEDGTHSRADFNHKSSSRYLDFLARIDKLQKLAPDYWTEVSTGIFEDIVRQSNKQWLLQKAMDDVADDNIDYSKIQAAAQARRAAVGATASSSSS